MATPRAILHVDMDAFFASVEQLDHPELKGRPVLVGHDGRRGVVAAASYEARKFGCHSAQPMAVAKRRCPHAVVMPGRGWRYREVSDQVFALFHQVTPLVEPLSIDEAFLDVTGSVQLLGKPEEIARELRRKIHAATGVTASVGVAPNKFVAKLASDMDKPDGLTVIPQEKVAEILGPLPIGRMWGVGPATEARLVNLGILTFADVRRRSLSTLSEQVGSYAERLWRLSAGEDDRPVVPDHEAKSIGHEQTFGEDLRDPRHVRQVMARQVEQVGVRLRRHGFEAKTVTVKIRYGNFETITRSTTLAEPTASTDRIWRAARGLFDRWAEAGYRPVRLIGVSTSHFGGGEAQLGLFEDRRAELRGRIDSTTDRIKEKYGKAAVLRAAALSTRPSSKDAAERRRGKAREDAPRLGALWEKDLGEEKD